MQSRSFLLLDYHYKSPCYVKTKYYMSLQLFHIAHGLVNGRYNLSCSFLMKRPKFAISLKLVWKNYNASNTTTLPFFFRLKCHSCYFWFNRNDKNYVISYFSLLSWCKNLNYFVKSKQVHHTISVFTRTQYAQTCHQRNCQNMMSWLHFSTILKHYDH